MAHKEKNNKTRKPLCGNCKHFVIGGLCELVRGQINSKATCDLHKFGDSHPIDAEVNPDITKTKSNYKPGFFIETTLENTITEDIANDTPQGKAQQMYYSLIQRGIPPKEAHRATIQYYDNPTPKAIPWPGDMTGVDLAGNINNILTLDSGTPLTNFNAMPQNREPYPTSNVSPYGIGSTSQPYPSFYSPSENSGIVSPSYDILNVSYPHESTNWTGLSSDVNSHPSMHGETGYNVSVTIPPWRYDVEQSQMYPTNGNGIAIPPSGAIVEAKKDDTKKKLLDRITQWSLLLGGIAGMNAIIKNYLNSETDGPLEIIAQYNYHGHDNDDECSKFAGKRFDLLETHDRPVIPSEKLGYTTQHPNCKCTWDVQVDAKPFTNKLTKKQQDNIDEIETHINDAAAKGTLHSINSDGILSEKTTKKNPLKELCDCMNVTIPTYIDVYDNSGRMMLKRKTLQEAINNLRKEFVWLTDDYLSNAKKLANDAGGELYLIRAASESITDHRSEGESHRRKLSADELNSMTRTIIGKSMDINHQPEFEVDATIIDAEFDKYRKEIQTLVIVKDNTINDAIDDGVITAVSINGGMPRSESVEKCDHNCTDDSCELCLVPKGVVLGELDGVGMTFVVTNPNGLYWNGHHVSSAEPGIKVTRIEKL